MHLLPLTLLCPVPWRCLICSALKGTIVICVCPILWFAHWFLHSLAWTDHAVLGWGALGGSVSLAKWARDWPGHVQFPSLLIPSDTFQQCCDLKFHHYFSLYLISPFLPSSSSIVQNQVCPKSDKAMQCHLTNPTSTTWECNLNYFCKLWIYYCGWKSQDGVERFAGDS